MISLRLPPTFIVPTPSVQPGITRFKGNDAGMPRSRELSNFVPFVSHPVYCTVTVMQASAGEAPVPTCSSMYLSPLGVVWISPWSSGMPGAFPSLPAPVAGVAPAVLMDTVGHVGWATGVLGRARLVVGPDDGVLLLEPLPQAAESAAAASAKRKR